MSLVPGQYTPSVQLDALQKALNNGGLTPITPTYSPQDQKAADILKNPGPMTPNPAVNYTPVGSSSVPSNPTPTNTNSNGFWNWLSTTFGGSQSPANQTAAVGNAASSSAPSTGGVIQPTRVSAPIVYGTAGNPAGSGAQANRAPVSTENVGGSQATSNTKTYGPAGTSASDLSQYSSQTTKPAYTVEQARGDYNQLAQAQQQRAADAAAKLKSAQDAASQATEQQKNNPYSPESDAYIQQMNALVQNAQRDYQAAILPNAALSEAEQQVQALEAQKSKVAADLGEKTYNVNKEPIPAKFLEGWGTEFNKEANAKLGQISSAQIPLQQRLATLQARQSAALDAAKSGVENAKESRKQAGDVYKTNWDRQNSVSDKQAAETLATNKENSKPITLSEGQTEFRFNPQTGKYEQIATGGAKTYAPKAQPKAPVQYSDVRSLPESIRNDVLDDVVLNKGTLDQLYGAYPEISKDTIKKLYEQFSLQGKNLTSSGRSI